MDGDVKSVSWEGESHHHSKKGSDWYWVVGIVTAAVAVAAVLLGNLLFGVLVIVAGVVTIIHANRPPQIQNFAVTTRGVAIEDKLYPYSTLDAYFIDEEDPLGPQLFVRSQKVLMPLLVLPIPEEYLQEIDELIAERLPEEFMEEPLAHKVLELIGF